MMLEIAKLHARALPHTSSSRRGVRYVAKLYQLVARIGYVKTITRAGEIVGAISGIGPLILTLVVDPEWQRKGIGRELIKTRRGRQYVYTEEGSRGFYEKVGFSQVIRLGKVIFLWRK